MVSFVSTVRRVVLFLAIVTVLGLIFGRRVHADAAPTTAPATQPSAAAGS